MIRIRHAAILEPLCWFWGHVWREYAVIHVAWNRPGRYCLRCYREELYQQDFTTEWTPVRSDDDE